MARKCATLAHWVPHLSLIVYQPNWPPILVSQSPQTAPSGEVWTHIHPCDFRAELMSGADQRVVGPVLGRHNEAIKIVVMADANADVDFDNAGIFTLAFDDVHTAMGFATLASTQVPGGIPECQMATQTCQWCLDDPPIALAVDPLLGTQLVSCTFPTNDPLRTPVAQHTLFEALMHASAEEVAYLAQTP